MIRPAGAMAARRPPKAKAERSSRSSVVLFCSKGRNLLPISLLPFRSLPPYRTSTDQKPKDQHIGTYIRIMAWLHKNVQRELVEILMFENLGEKVGRKSWRAKPRQPCRCFSSCPKFVTNTAVRTHDGFGKQS